MSESKSGSGVKARNFQTAKVRDYCAVSIIGLGIGFLTGMSASPVLSGVLTTILALVAALVSAATGLTNSEKPDSPPSPKLRLSLNPVPLALLIVFLVIGAAVGLSSRVNEWLGPTPKTVALRWKSAGLRLSDEQILSRLFEREFSGDRSLTTTEHGPSTRPDKPYLFAKKENLCNAIVPVKEEAALRHELEQSGVEELVEISKVVNDPKILKVVAEVILCGKRSSQ